MIVVAITPLKNINGTAYYVSQGGSGDGLTPSTPMSPADFLVLVLQNNDLVFFLAGDEF